MDRERWRRIIHRLFDIGVIVKGIDGVLETIGGVLLLLIGPTQLSRVARIVTQHELTHDRHDRVARYLLNSVHQLEAGAKTFAAIYLLWHGVVKVGLVTGLLLRRRWVYPVAIVAFAIFLVYQLYRYSLTHAPELLVLSLFDVVVIVLTWSEYKHLIVAHASS